jgi:hypothetical protein
MAASGQLQCDRIRRNQLLTGINTYACKKGFCMARNRIWKVVILGWVMLAATANSSPSQPTWVVAGTYSSGTDCVAAIAKNLAASSVTGEITGWVSGALGTVTGGKSNAAPVVTPVVCLPTTHPWVTAVQSGNSAASPAPTAGQ